MTDTTGDTGYTPRPKSRPRALLRRVREIMAGETAPQARLDALVQSIASNMVADVCSIYVRRPDDYLELFATQGLKPEAVHSTRLNFSEGLVGWVATNRRPKKLREAQKHEAFSYRPETGEDPYNAFLGVPIIRSGQVLGVLVIQNTALRHFSEEETEVALTVATVLAEIISIGGLLDEQDTEEVEALLHQHERASGKGVVPGLARGVVVRRETKAPAHPVFAESVTTEQRRLDDALARMRKSVDDMVASDRGLGQASQEILEVFRLFAYDKGWAQRLEAKVLDGLSAESAVAQVQEDNRIRMRSVADPYLRDRLHDLEDLSGRLLRVLGGGEGGLGELPDNAVFVAETLGPAELLELDRTKLAGLVVGEGSGTSHATIVARSLNLPMVSGVSELVEMADSGDLILLDGSVGEVHLRPSDDVITAFDEKVKLRVQMLARYGELKDLPSVTLDGRAVDLQLNAGLLLDMPQLDESGAAGIGLFRTELQFLLAKSLPTAQDQETFYRQVIDLAEGRPVVFRTADIGSDKQADYMQGPIEANPAMGWRGLRVALDRQGFMRTQIRALLSAAGERPLSIMLPLVTTTEEFSSARAIIDKEMSRHEKHVGPLPSSVEIGAMVEIPSAAWDVAGLAEVSDFLSIGGNDLAQFFFAADRQSELVSGRYDPLSQAFLGFLARIVSEAHGKGKPVGYCGEQAGDPLMALALIGIGVDRLSVAAPVIAPLKAMIRTMNYEKLTAAVADLIADPSSNPRAVLSTFAIEQGIELA